MFATLGMFLDCPSCVFDTEKQAWRKPISFSWTPISARPCAVRGRLAAPWFRLHPAECRVGQARHLVIAFIPSNGA